MAKQQKRDKRSYLNHFEQGPDGSYVYTGVTWHADPAVRQRMLVKLWALQAAMILSVVLPGALTTAGLLNTFYVIIPYVFWFISEIVLTYTLGSMTLGGNPLRDYVYQRSVSQYATRVMFPLAGAAMTALAMIVFLALDGNGDGAALCLVCCGVQIAASIIAYRIKVAAIWSC